MKKIGKRMNISILVLIVLFLGLGYAILQTNLDIIGVTSISSASWDIHFDNVQVIEGSVTATTAAHITNPTTVEYSIMLNEPGYFYEFDVDVVNAGSIDGMVSNVSSKLNNVEITSIPEYMEYSVSYSDGVAIEENQLLAAGVTDTYRVQIAYKRDITASQLPSTDQSLSFVFTVTYVQADENAVERDHNNPLGKSVISDAGAKEQTVSECEGKTMVTENGVTYMAGTPECVDFNHVWYSGKMWRIVAIYPDETMKLATTTPLTSMMFSTSTSPYFYDTNTGTKSYVFQWLNEDFLDTLYQYEDFLVTDSNTYWNMSSSSDYTAVPEETAMIPTSVSPVGLLNVHEAYLIAGRLQSLSRFYLTYMDTSSTPYAEWFVNNSDNKVWRVSSGFGPVSLIGDSYHIRPTVYLKSGLSYTGSGTSTDPYRLDNDKSFHSGDLLNTRLSGEYVQAGDHLYQILSIEDSNTKVLYDYHNSVISGKLYGTFGQYLNSCLEDDDSIDCILNNEWFNSLSYKNKLVKGTYYFGNVLADYSYKSAVCSTDTTERISTCEKATSNQMYVGLQRYGEMFTQRNESGYNRFITISYSNNDWITGYNFYGTEQHSITQRCIALPTIHFNSNVHIVSGSGLFNDPFIIE